MRNDTKIRVIDNLGKDDGGYSIRVKIGEILIVKGNGLYYENGSYACMLKYAKPKINVEVILTKEEQDELDFNNRIEKFLLSPKGQSIINARAEQIDEYRRKQEREANAYKEKMQLKRSDYEETKNWNRTSFGENMYENEAKRILELVNR